MPTVPLAVATQELLKKKYEALKAEGKDDDSISAELAASTPGIIVFSQIDCDHNGSISKKELQRMLKSLPRNKPVPPPGGWPDGAAPAFVPFEKVLSTLDSDGDGVISMTEWLDNLEKLPGLKAAIDGAIDPATGRIAGYVSLEARIEQLLAEAAALEEAAPEPDEAQTAQLAARMPEGVACEWLRGQSDLV